MGRRIAAAVTMAIGAVVVGACDQPRYRLVLTYPDSETLDRAAWVEIYLDRQRSCEQLRSDPGTARLEFRANAEPPNLGTVEFGHAIFYARVRAANCAVIADGCREVEVQSGRDLAVRISLMATSGAGCAGAYRCSNGRCSNADGGGSDTGIADVGGSDRSTADAQRDAHVDAHGDTAPAADAAVSDTVVRDLTTRDIAAADSATRDANTVDTAAADATRFDANSADAAWQSPAAEMVFSVGQNLADHKTGAPTVTVAAGVAFFSQAQTTGNMGIGDVVTYVSRSNSHTCFLQSKITNRIWRCANGTGGYPTPASDVPVVSIAHAFDSLAHAIAGAADARHLQTSDLEAAGIGLGIACYNDSGGADTERAVVTGYTAAPSSRIRIFTPADTITDCNLSQRHRGIWDNSKYRLEVNGLAWNDASINLRVPFTQVDGLQVFASGDGNTDGISTTGAPAGKYYISNNIVVGLPGPNSENSDGICVHGGSAGQEIYAWNNVLYGWNLGTGQASAFYNDTAAGILLVAYNNTMVDCDYGIYGGAGTSVAKNNIADTNVRGFRGSYAASSGANISSHDDAPGAGSKNSTTLTFVNRSGRDFHLSLADTAAIGAGLDLAGDSVLVFDRDIDGELRAAPWDIGADEVL